MSDDVCSHGRPDHQELVRQVREAAGMFAGAMPVSPKEAFEQALEDIRGQREHVSAREARCAEYEATSAKVIDDSQAEMVALLERLGPLEEIAKRVADGWTPLPADGDAAAAWVHAHDPSEPEMSSEVAAVLWPDPPEET